ncbi:hypothetical protein BGZ76_010492 [Entomortierella beljakovae]|nr:hypothetical protein BGZ76_010492 [Entomortierella beljakovae]
MSQKEEGIGGRHHKNTPAAISRSNSSSFQYKCKDEKKIIDKTAYDIVNAVRNPQHKRFPDSDNIDTEDSRPDRSSTTHSISRANHMERKSSTQTDDQYRTIREIRERKKSLSNDDRSTGTPKKDTTPMMLTTTNRPSIKKTNVSDNRKSLDLEHLETTDRRHQNSWNNNDKPKVMGSPFKGLLRPFPVSPSTLTSPTKQTGKATRIDVPSTRVDSVDFRSPSPSQNNHHYRNNNKPNYPQKSESKKDHKDRQSPSSSPRSKADSSPGYNSNTKSSVKMKELKDTDSINQRRHENIRRELSGSEPESDLEDADPFKAPPLGLKPPSSPAPSKSPSRHNSSTGSPSSFISTKSTSDSNTPPRKNKTLIPDNLSSDKALSKKTENNVPDEIKLFSSDSEGSDFQKQTTRDHTFKSDRLPRVDREKKKVSRIEKPSEPRYSKPMVVTARDRELCSDLMPKALQFSSKSDTLTTSTTNSRDDPFTDYFFMGSRGQPKPSPKHSDFDKKSRNTMNKPSYSESSIISSAQHAKRNISPSSDSDSDIQESGSINRVGGGYKFFDLSPEETTEINDVANWTPSSKDKFQLPSPSKKRVRYSDELMMNLPDDDLEESGLMSVFDNNNVCPYCGDRLPENKSVRLASALAKIQSKRQSPGKEQLQQQQQQQQLDEVIDLNDDNDYYSSQQSDDVVIIDNPFLVKKVQPRPRRLERKKKEDIIDLVVEDTLDRHEESEESTLQVSSSSRVPLLERFEFCRIHVAEERIVPMGIKRGYPTVIDFSKLEDRVNKFVTELIRVISKKTPSVFLDSALERYRSMGTLGARRAHVVLANVEKTIPGYYGSKGSAELSRILAKIFLESNLLTHEHSDPQKPIEYIQQVLVPEAGLRLIAEDRTLLNHMKDGGQSEKVSLEEALEIMQESVEFGSYMHDVLETI